MPTGRVRFLIYVCGGFLFSDSSLRHALFPLVLPRLLRLLQGFTGTTDQYGSATRRIAARAA